MGKLVHVFYRSNCIVLKFVFCVLDQDVVFRNSCDSNSNYNIFMY